MTDFQPGITIGRDPSCDLVVDDPYVSKKHALVSLHDGRLWVQDLGSINGTYINGGLTYYEAQVAPDTTIRMGHTEWTGDQLLRAIRERFG